VWPGILLGYGDLPLPYDVPANEWMQVSGGKLSKSRSEGKAAFAPDLLAQYPPDVIRFYAALLAPQNHDTELDWDEFRQVRQEILSNQYGNLVQRLLVFCRDRFHGEVPEPPQDWDTGAPDGAGARIRAVHDRITREFEAVRLKEALDIVLSEVRDLNRRFQEARPWQASEDARRTTVYEGVWWLKALATWLAPFLPFSSAEVYRMLGYHEPPHNGGWEAALDPVPAHQRLGEVRPLFPREEAAPSAPPAPSNPPAETVPLALRAARVREVEPHPSADKLYVLRLDVGASGDRTVVAGIRPFYAPAELVGRSIVLLSNLEPRTIRRMTSQGMLLAADSGDRALLIAPPPDCPPGTLLDGVDEPARTIRYDEFERAPLAVGKVVGKGDAFLTVSLGPREVQVPGNAEVGSLVVVRSPGSDGTGASLLTMMNGSSLGPDPATPPGSRVR
jgi:methionyl-tRNA synthetase